MILILWIAYLACVLTLITYVVTSQATYRNKLKDLRKQVDQHYGRQKLIRALDRLHLIDPLSGELHHHMIGAQIKYLIRMISRAIATKP